MKKYSESHEWVEAENGNAVIGITRFAAKELGDIVFVELPQVGQTLHANDVACVLESTKAAADVYAPISGTVIEVNSLLLNDLSKVGSHSETEGWLYKCTIIHREQLDTLMDEKAYEKMIQGK